MTPVSCLATLTRTVESKAHKRTSLLHRWRWQITLISATIICLGAADWWRSPLRLLRFHGSDLREHYEGGGFTGDYVRCIRAKCTEELFHRYAQQQGLKHILSGSLPEGCAGWYSFSEPWWTPPRSYGGTYCEFRPGGYRRLLAYSDGFLYYDISAW